MYRNMIVLIECVVSNSERNPERVCLTFFSHVCVTFCPGYEAGCFEVCVCRGGGSIGCAIRWGRAFLYEWF